MICAKLYTDQCRTSFDAAVQDLFGQWNYSLSMDFKQLQSNAQAKDMTLYFSENDIPLVASKLQSSAETTEQLFSILQEAGFAPHEPPLLTTDEMICLDSVRLDNQKVRITAHK